MLGADIGLDSAITWAGLVGMTLPPVVAFLQDDGFSDKVNGVIFGLCAVGASLGLEFVRLNGHFNWQDWSEELLIIAGLAIAFYKTYWSPSGQISAVRNAGPFTPKQKSPAK